MRAVSVIKLNAIQVLALSSFGVVVGVWIKRRLKLLEELNIPASILGGLVFLIVKAFEWTHEIQLGYTLTSNTFWSFYYTAAGLHALHVIAGMILMGYVAKDAAHGRELHRVELVGLYWHFVDIVWIFLFPLLYIAK